MFIGAAKSLLVPYYRFASSAWSTFYCLSALRYMFSRVTPSPRSSCASLIVSSVALCFLLAFPVGTGSPARGSQWTSEEDPRPADDFRALASSEPKRDSNSAFQEDWLLDCHVCGGQALSSRYADAWEMHWSIYSSAWRIGLSHKSCECCVYREIQIIEFVMQGR